MKGLLLSSDGSPYALRAMLATAKRTCNTRRLVTMGRPMATDRRQISRMAKRSLKATKRGQQKHGRTRSGSKAPRNKGNPGSKATWEFYINQTPKQDRVVETIVPKGGREGATRDNEGIKGRFAGTRRRGTSIIEVRDSLGKHKPIPLDGRISRFNHVFKAG